MKRQIQLHDTQKQKNKNNTKENKNKSRVSPFLKRIALIDLSQLASAIASFSLPQSKIKRHSGGRKAEADSRDKQSLTS